MSGIQILSVCVIVGFIIIAAWMRAHYNENKRLEGRLRKLEVLEAWTIRDVASRLKDSFIILAGDRQVMKDTEIHLPDGKKYGVLCLGNETMIMGSIIRGCKERAKT